MDKVLNVTGKAVGAFVAAVLIFMLGINSVYTIKEQEQAVVVTFGIPATVSEPGLHFKIPFIQQVKKVNTTIKGFAIGYDINNNDIKTAESLMITSD